MGRRVERLTIPGVRSEAPGERDNGKTFLLREMDSYTGQKWAFRVLKVLASSGLQLPDGALEGGWAGLASFAFHAIAKASTAEIEPLLDEMLGQASYEHPGDGKRPPIAQPIVRGVNCQIEEIKTFATIQMELFKLHAGFTVGASIPTTA